jgi:F-type H+-transporting ATPase subunit gamma
MANLKEVRNRITSVSSTQQITSAMKMVSASKLRRAQDAIQRMRPYASKLKEILQNLSASLDSSSGGGFSKEREVKNVLFVVINSNRGLCGAFNSNAIKLTNNLINEKYPSQKAAGGVHILTIGKKATDYFKKSACTLASSHNEVYDNLKFDTVAPIAEKIMADFAAGKYDRVELVYSQFKNAAVQIVTSEQFLPVKSEAIAGNVKAKSVDYIFEPNKEEIVEDLIPKSLKIQLYKAVLDSNASEHGARMTSMHKATDNAKELLKSLKLSYNKARQAAITNEILEIGGGAAALEG